MLCPRPLLSRVRRNALGWQAHRYCTRWSSSSWVKLTSLPSQEGKEAQRMAPARCFRPRPRKRRWRAGPGEGRNPRRRRWRAVPGDGEHGEHSAAAAMESRIRRGWADGAGRLNRCEGGAGVGGPRVVVAPSLGAAPTGGAR